MPSSLERTSDTSVKFRDGRPFAPPNMTSSMSLPRSCLALCSPKTQRIASTMLLFPQPLGPTTAQIPVEKVTVALSTKDLNPKSSSCLMCMGLLKKGQVRVRTDCPVWAVFRFHSGLASSSKKSPNANKKAEPCKGILL